MKPLKKAPTNQAPLPKTFGKREADGSGDLVPDQCPKCRVTVEHPEQIKRSWCSRCTLYFAINGLDPRRMVAA